MLPVLGGKKVQVQSAECRMRSEGSGLKKSRMMQPLRFVEFWQTTDPGWAGLALVLAGARVAAAPGETNATEKPRANVSVFRLDGPPSEAPEGDASLIFSGPASSLKVRFPS